MKPEFINGPTNFACLNGTFAGVQKEIYVFFDKHLDLDDQTRCKSFNSIDISYYLYTLIKESKENLDFFMEIRTSQLDKQITNKKDIYINEVINLFISEFETKKNDVNDNNDNNNENIKHLKKNVKLHYFDIRDHLNIFYLTKIITQKILKYLNLYSTNDENNKYIEKIIFYIDQINEKIKSLDKNTKEVMTNNNVTYNKINDPNKYYLDKIINRYNNDILGKNINLFLNIHCGGIINSIDTLIKNTKYMLTNSILMNKEELGKNIDKLSEYILQLYSFYTDAYLLRRIIDKNYVKKSIIYAGGSHSINIIFFLVKFCNFSIIKIQKSKEKNISLLTNKICNSLYSFDIYELFLLKKIYIQCIHYEPVLINDTIGSGLRKYSKLNIANK